MKKLIISVSYQFDKEAWQDSGMKMARVLVDGDIHTQMQEAIQAKDFVEFAKSTKPEPMYRDDKEGNARQVGWVYRFSSEIQHDDGKWHTYRGDAWVEIHGELVDFTF